MVLLGTTPQRKLTNLSRAAKPNYFSEHTAGSHLFTLSDGNVLHRDKVQSILRKAANQLKLHQGGRSTEVDCPPHLGELLERESGSRRSPTEVLRMSARPCAAAGGKHERLSSSSSSYELP